MEKSVLAGQTAEPPSEETKPPSEETQPPSLGLAALEVDQADNYLFPLLKSTIHPFSRTKSRRVGPQAVRRTWSPTVSPSTQVFIQKHFPEISLMDWNDWRWQFANRVTSLEGLTRFLELGSVELAAFEHIGRTLPLSITPYYLSLVAPHDPDCPIRRCVVPTAAEGQVNPGEADDPLGEDGHTLAPGLVHRYPDRVLLLVTGTCSTYCRYCTRSRLVAGRGHNCSFDTERLKKALAYIKATPSVRDVLISGGDPLTLNDDQIEWVLKRLRAIDHVELVRVGTKAPVVLPQRITPALTRMLKRYHPLFISIHFTHPAELTPEVGEATGRLADAGIPLGSQTVLLSGINDNVATMTALVRGLLKMRVRPYYLYQCDPITGSGHFRTPVAKGLEIIKGLRGHTTGYGVPTYVIDAPGGGGKVALYPESVMGRQGHELILSNYAGLNYRYPDTAAGPGSEPLTESKVMNLSSVKGLSADCQPEA